MQAVDFSEGMAILRQGKLAKGNFDALERKQALRSAAVGSVMGAAWVLAILALANGPLRRAVQWVEALEAGAPAQLSGTRRLMAEHPLQQPHMGSALPPPLLAGQAAAAGLHPLLPLKKDMKLPWQPLLAEEEVARGISYYGSGRRLEAVAAKLLAGRAIKVFTLGGAVTAGVGASSPDCTSYPARLFQYINTTFPHPGHVFSNQGMGASSSGIFAACLDQIMAPDADLVVLELTFDEHPDRQFASRQRRGYEQLLRKLMRLPGRPAIVLLHYWAWWKARGDGAKEGLFYFPAAEAQLTVLSQYYDIPAVSLRSAVHPLMRVGVTGFKPDLAKPEWFSDPVPGTEQGEQEEPFYADSAHPGDRGHTVLAELLAGLLAQAVGAEEAAGESGAKEDQWAPPRSDRRYKAVRRLPPPMIPESDQGPAAWMCTMREGLAQLAVTTHGFHYRPVRPNATGTEGQQWGWTAEDPGAAFEMQFDSRSPASAAERAAAEQSAAEEAVGAASDSNSGSGSGSKGKRAGSGNGSSSGAGSSSGSMGSSSVEQPGSHPAAGQSAWATLHLAHLLEGQGEAAVKCISGCQCKWSTFGGPPTQGQQASLLQVHSFAVTQHALCRVRVTVRKPPGGGAATGQAGHRVTLLAVVVSPGDQPGSMQTGLAKLHKQAGSS